jgi:di/tricarboxylate transporter
MPTPHAVLLLVVTVAAFYLYTRPWIRLELVSLLLLVTLLLIFYLFPFDATEGRLTEVEIFQSFGHPAVVAICSLMILARGLTTTGAMEPVVRFLNRVWRVNRWLGLFLTLLVAGTASAFINDTPVLVLMLPLLLGLAERTNYPASKTLMPVNFAILAGGMLTSIGTSTNVLVLQIAGDLGMAPMGLFDFTSTAAMAFAIALLYLWLIAPHLLPDNGKPLTASGRVYEASIRVDDGNNKLNGRNVDDLARPLGRPPPVFAVLRDARELTVAEAGQLAAGDVLLLRDTPKGLRELAIHPDRFRDRAWCAAWGRSVRPRGPS